MITSINKKQYVKVKRVFDWLIGNYANYVIEFEKDILIFAKIMGATEEQLNNVIDVCDTMRKDCEAIVQQYNAITFDDKDHYDLTADEYEAMFAAYRLMVDQGKSVVEQFLDELNEMSFILDFDDEHFEYFEQATGYQHQWYYDRFAERVSSYVDLASYDY